MNQFGAVPTREVRLKRDTCESALRAEGIDEVFVARKLKDLLGAQRRRWNPKKGSWQKFEDYSTQLAALRETAKILGLYAKDSEEDVPLRIDISAIPRTRERVQRDDDHSIGTAADDGRERRERCKGDTTVLEIGSDVLGNRTTAKP